MRLLRLTQHEAVWNLEQFGRTFTLTIMIKTMKAIRVLFLLIIPVAVAAHPWRTYRPGCKHGDLR